MNISVLRRLHDVRFYAAFISILLSVWGIYLDNVINNDGVLYLRVAELIGQDEWRAAFSLYKWPFYSILISLTSHLTGLNLEFAAHLLNAILVVLIVVSFITIIQALGGDRKTAIIAAAVILLYPGLNKYRSFIIRDFGYLAFYLLALTFFFKNLKDTQWRRTLSWASSLLIAGLFRIEGFVFLLTIPLLLQTRKWVALRSRIKLFFIFGASLLVLFLLFSWWFIGQPLMSDSPNLGNVTELARQAWINLLNVTSERITVLRDAGLPKYTDDYAPLIYITALISILIYELIRRVTLIYSILAGHAWYRGLIFPVKSAKSIWLGLLLVHLAILAVILVERFYLTGRFSVALSLTVMLAVPFSLSALYENWLTKRSQAFSRNWAFPVVCLLIILTALPGLTAYTRKDYLKQAGIWLMKNSSDDQKVYSNSTILLHYSKKEVFERSREYNWEFTQKLITSGKWRDYDYLAINIKHKQVDAGTAFTKAFGKQPIKIFANNKGDKVLIFAPKGVSSY